MKEGTFLRQFKANDGRDVILRAPRWSDLDDLLVFINSLIEEGAEIAWAEIMTREKEAEWLGRHLAAIESDRKVALVAEVSGSVVGQVEVTPRTGYSRHVGEIAIALSEGYRDVGIGTEMMREAENQAKHLGLEILTLWLYATNNRARHVYQKVGFQVVGQTPRYVKRDGIYIDRVTMMKELSTVQ